MIRIKITIGEISVMASLDESNTARLLEGALPLESTSQLWGNEVYFQTPVDTEEENAQAEIPSGTIAYWPPGKALCLFFGQKPYSPVNVVGRLEGDPMVLADAIEGASVRVERA